MRSKLQLLVLIIIFVARPAAAATGKYRLVLLDDPATTVTIGWDQISGEDAVVRYGPVDLGRDAALYPTTATVASGNDYHGMKNRFASLFGLQANTDYYFVIEDGNSVSQRYWFRTAPAEDSPLTFVAGGDSRNNRASRLNANRLVSKLKPHAVFFGGDMIDLDVGEEWWAWFQDWQATTSADGRMIPIVPARGNHEAPETISQLFNTPKAVYYALDWGEKLIRTYTLNSEAPVSIGSAQMEWLSSDLEEYADRHWKMAQYHRPMRPHAASKWDFSEGYDAWARLFFDNDVRLVIDCDSHVTKTTWPLEPSSRDDHDEGFIRNDTRGTIYTGEGCWGAPLRAADDDKSWTRNSGSFNQFNLIHVSRAGIQLRVILTDNADEVAENDNWSPPGRLPVGLEIWSPSNGAVVTIKPRPGSCPAAGTSCDDTDPRTIDDVEDGACACAGNFIGPSGTSTDSTATEGGRSRRKTRPGLPTDPEVAKPARPGNKAGAVVDRSGNTTKRDNTAAVIPYPNPTDGVVYFPTSQAIRELVVYEARGRLIRRVSNTKELDLSALRDGVYLIKMVPVEGVAEAFRIVRR